MSSCLFIFPCLWENVIAINFLLKYKVTLSCHHLGVISAGILIDGPEIFVNEFFSFFEIVDDIRLSIR